MILEGMSGHGTKRSQGRIEVNEAECKGCGLCVEACPPRVISLGDALNHYGYRTAIYAGGGCTGCGVCFLACPEPGALSVLRLTPGAVIPIDSRGAATCASN